MVQGTGCEQPVDLIAGGCPPSRPVTSIPRSPGSAEPNTSLAARCVPISIGSLLGQSGLAARACQEGERMVDSVLASIRVRRRSAAGTGRLRRFHFLQPLPGQATIVAELQGQLQRFARRWPRPRALRIFRDVTNLSVSPDAWAGIEHALSESRWLILVASPEAAGPSGYAARSSGGWITGRQSNCCSSSSKEGSAGMTRKVASTPGFPKNRTSEDRRGARVIS